MRKTLFIAIVVLLSSVSVQAQKIEMKKVFGGYTFSQSGKNLNLKQMQEIMKDNKEAFDLVQSAKSNQTWAMILGASGGALIGFPIGTAIGGGDAEWALAGAGVALIAASIPIVKGFNKKTSKAVELYNSEISSSAYYFDPSFQFYIRGTNFGITMNF